MKRGIILENVDGAIGIQLQGHHLRHHRACADKDHCDVPGLWPGMHLVSYEHIACRQIMYEYPRSNTENTISSQFRKGASNSVQPSLDIILIATTRDIDAGRRAQLHGELDSTAR
eukprot:scaffold170175_cov16-Prasinocladus_malaysianus.AAC.1